MLWEDLEMSQAAQLLFYWQDDGAAALCVSSKTKIYEDHTSHGLVLFCVLALLRAAVSNNGLNLELADKKSINQSIYLVS